MPLFEYSCRACGRRFEMFVTADRAPSCPECHGADLVKQLTSPGMVGVGAPRATAAPAQPSGGCGAGGAGCACRMN